MNFYYVSIPVFVIVISVLSVKKYHLRRFSGEVENGPVSKEDIQKMIYIFTVVSAIDILAESIRGILQVLLDMADYVGVIFFPIAYVAIFLGIYYMYQAVTLVVSNIAKRIIERQALKIRDQKWKRRFNRRDDSSRYEEDFIDLDYDPDFDPEITEEDNDLQFINL